MSPLFERIFSLIGQAVEVPDAVVETGKRDYFLSQMNMHADADHVANVAIATLALDVLEAAMTPLMGDPEV